jgi:hypothetical protein
MSFDGFSISIVDANTVRLSCPRAAYGLATVMIGFITMRYLLTHLVRSRCGIDQRDLLGSPITSPRDVKTPRLRLDGREPRPLSSAGHHIRSGRVSHTPHKGVDVVGRPAILPCMKRVIGEQTFDVEVEVLVVVGSELGACVRAIVFRDGVHETWLTTVHDSRFPRDSKFPPPVTADDRLAPLVDDVKRKMRVDWVTLDGAFARFCPAPECHALLYVTSEQITKTEMGKCPNGHPITFS